MFEDRYTVSTIPEPSVAKLGTAALFFAHREDHEWSKIHELAIRET